MKRFTSADEREEAMRSIVMMLDARGEWFCAGSGSDRVGVLRRGEWELSARHGGLFFSCAGERGVLVWRVVGWEQTGERLRLGVVRRVGAESATLELIPRASHSAAKELLTAARRAACERLAALLASTLNGATVERARLSSGPRRGEPGRYARVLLRRGVERIAATGPVVELAPGDVDAFLASTLIWFARLNDSGRSPHARRLYLVVGRVCLDVTVERLGLLREELRRALLVYEVDADGESLREVRVPGLEELLSAGASFRRPAKFAMSELAARVVELAPGAIDTIPARHGETLRFHGLSFARVRRVMGHEHLWFGAGPHSKRRLLDESNWHELARLIDELNEHRREGTNHTNHALYRAAPEAWLESLLRRDITRLDPGLRLSPLHAQFRLSHGTRAAARPVDLLAIRRDGRLVVVELKVAEDAALALQGADYWRRVEAERRRNWRMFARLFDGADVADSPPLVYLVGPLLRFHRSFNTLVQSIHPSIETYRFDINEDWRAGVRVVRLGRVG